MTPVSGCVLFAATAGEGSVGTVRGMGYASDLTDEQWALLEPVFNASGKRGPEHAPNLRRVVDPMLYIAHTGCRWRFVPESFGPWTRVCSQVRRWSRNGTWARALIVLHRAARVAEGRAAATPSMVVIDTHLARGASNGECTVPDRGGPDGRTKGAQRVVAGDVPGLPVVRWSSRPLRTRTGPARCCCSTWLGRASPSGWSWFWWTVASPRPAHASSADARASRCAGSGGMTSSRCSGRSATPGASRSPTAGEDAPAAW